MVFFAQSSDGSVDAVSESIVDTYNNASNWISTHINPIVQIIIIVILSWFTVHVASKLLSQFLRRTIRKDMYPTKTDRDKRISTLDSICIAVIRFIVWIIAGFLILDTIGINTGPLLASAGIIGVALGFGTQSLVKDFVSGLFIIVENQYRVGDFIEVQGVSGMVESISMRTTVLRDVDGSVHCVPNGSIVVSTNKTMGAGHTVLDITVDPEADLHAVETTINEVGESMANDKTLEEMIVDPPHFIRISEFTDKGVTIKVSSTTASGKQLEIKSAFLSRLQVALKKKNIKVISAVTTKSKK